MIDKDKTERGVKWYQENKPIYEKLAKKIETIIREVLESKGIACNSVSSRVKEVDSFRKKASKDKYGDPTKEITDLAGIRVIAYVNSDVNKICTLIEGMFAIDSANSMDKSQLLGVDRVGYRSIHYVATLSEDRAKLLEFQMFMGIPFEIQVRSILQHAWAEIEHDRNYKFHGVLPEHIKRSFSLVAGVLELADREFDAIATEIDRYAESVNEDMKTGKISSILINTTSLKKYLLLKFDDGIKAGLKPNFGDDTGATEIVEELNHFGIKTLADLELVIPTDFKHRASYEIENGNFIGLLRSVMIVNDPNKYFKHAWNGKWNGIDYYSLLTLQAYEVDADELVNRYGVDIQWDLNDEM